MDHGGEDQQRRKRARLHVIEALAEEIAGDVPYDGSQAGGMSTTGQSSLTPSHSPPTSPRAPKTSFFSNPPTPRPLSGVPVSPVKSPTNRKAPQTDVGLPQSAPKAFLCPLTLEIMYDPVMDRQGNTFELRPLLKWLQERSISPISRQPLRPDMLISNNALREVIHDFMGPEWVQRKRLAAKGTLSFELCQDESSEEDSSSWSEEDELATMATQANDTGRQQQQHVCRYRNKIDTYIQYLVASQDILSVNPRRNEQEREPLVLNEQGMVALSYEDIVIVLYVPEYGDGLFHLYTRGLVYASTTFDEALKDRLLDLNFLQDATRGGCLSIKRDGAQGQEREEVVFSYNDRVDEITGNDFRNIIANFVETAVALRTQLVSER